MSTPTSAPARPDAPPPTSPEETGHGTSQFSRGVRETIECVAIAFALAFLFKTFEAEAFVIPTGSMAPTLMGRHKDVVCPECDFRYSASGSEEADRDGTLRMDPRYDVIACTCPNCRYTVSVDPSDPANAGRAAKLSYSGDRIWVSKVPYNLMEPRRWDVIVFRFPEEAETYYISCLVGLPNEQLKIHHGDIYTKGGDDADFVIQRKPPDKVRAMSQVVYDNDYVADSLAAHGWPLRWQVWSEQETPGDWQVSEDTRSYQTDGTGAGEAWIRYQHIVPGQANWGRDHWPPKTASPPQLITDFYAFNTRVVRSEGGSFPAALGLHWVGDLTLDCEVDVQGTDGELLLNLCKGGRQFRCTIDVATGQADLSIDGMPDWKPTAATNVRGGGKYRVMFANVDQQLLLWVNDKVVAFDQPTAYPYLDNDRPQATGRDRGDLAPVGIGSRRAALAVNHLRVLRDVYYIAEKSRYARNVISDFRDQNTTMVQMNAEELADFFASPEKWQTPQGRNVFDLRQKVTFPSDDEPFGPDQFFVLGDNSPASSDARLWSSQNYVQRDLLVGKALFVYWPHPLDLYIPLTNISIGVIPNFPGMGFIR